MNTQLGHQKDAAALPRALAPGDKVRFLSPASTPDKESVMKRADILKSWGLEVDFGEHAFDKVAYLAGTDEERLADFNAALRDPDVRAICTTRGGKGSYRIAGQLDFEAARRDPKLVVGFSDISAIHLSLWKNSRLIGIHGALMDDENGRASEQSAESLRRVLMTSEDIVLQARAEEETSLLTTSGTAKGVLIGGNLTMIATLAGWALPDLRSAILLLEAVDMYLGQVDRILTRLRNAGHLEGLAGIAIGQFTDIKKSGPWTIIDMLRHHLEPLDIPILGGLPLGHGTNPLCTPLGTGAVLDTASGALTVRPAVRE